MAFKYVWGTMQVFTSPPIAEEFNTCQGEYRYYPFSNRGPIYTADYPLWEPKQKIGSVDSNVRITHWPSENEITRFIQEDTDDLATYMVVLVEKPIALTIDPSDSVPLQTVPSALTSKFLSDFTSYGYDVIDISGLSALVNIGYNAQDLCKLADSSIRVNQYGLISELNSSFLFAAFASDAAPEHTPLFPAELWIRPAKTGL